MKKIEKLCAFESKYGMISFNSPSLICRAAVGLRKTGRPIRFSPMHNLGVSFPQLRFSHTSLPPEYGLEALGEFQADWLDPLHPHRIRTTLLPQLETRAFLPSFKDWMAAPAYEAIIEFATTRPYHDVLQLIMEHAFFFLIQEVSVVITGAEDAPLPHVIYEDVMKVMTFASLQNAPEEQFQLSSSFRFSLLSTVALTCLHDNGYLFQAKCLFRKMEQQQSLIAQDYALMVWICAAAKDLKGSMQMLLWIHEQGFSFCPRVFSLLQHPFVDIRLVQSGQQPHVVKGLLLQERIARTWGVDSNQSSGIWNTNSSLPKQNPIRQSGSKASPSSFDPNISLRSTTDADVSNDFAVSMIAHRHKNAFAIGVHAVLVHYYLTRQYHLQWQWLDQALHQEEQHPGMCELGQRTVHLALDLFALEQGRYCNTSVVKRLFMALLRRADHFSLRQAPGSSQSSPSSESSSNPTVGTDVSLPAALLFLLMRVRRNEIAYLSGSAFDSPVAAPRFSEDEIEYAKGVLRKQAVKAARYAYDNAAQSLSDGEVSEDFAAREAMLYDHRFELVEPLVLGLMTTPQSPPYRSNASETTPEGLYRTESFLSPQGNDAPRSSSPLHPASKIPAYACSWKDLLQHCASFGREISRHNPDFSSSASSTSSKQYSKKEHRENVLTTNATSNSLSDTDKSMQSVDSHKSDTGSFSEPPSMAYARLLFQELKRLDIKGTSHSSNLREVRSGDEEKEWAKKYDQARETEQIQSALHTAGSSASQHYYTWQKVVEKREEDRLRERLVQDPTSVWTSI